MDWGDFKELVKEKVRFGDDSIVDLTNIAAGSDFEKFCLRNVNRALRESFWMYRVRMQVGMTGLNAGDYSLDTSNSNQSDRLFFALTYAEYEGSELGKASMEEVTAELHKNTDNGEPTAFALDHSGKLYFNKRLSAAFLSNDSLYISGWHEHPAIASDSTEFGVPDSVCDELAAYVAAKMIQPAVSTEDGYRRFGFLMNDAQRFFSKARHRAATALIGKAF